MIPASLTRLIQRARRVVALTGAGVSAESGIPTFRDALTGLWANFDAEALATPEAFARDPALVWGWYEWRRAKVSQAQPNPAHRALAELEAERPATRIVTQNVDDLHERAGSHHVVHLHGSLFAPRCFACGAPYARAGAAAAEEPKDGRRLEPPPCGGCGDRIRPGVVWFGEPLPPDAWQAAVEAVEGCDLLLVVGTSGLVHPAASLPAIARRADTPVVSINPQPSAIDAAAHHVLRGRAGTVLPALVEAALGRR